MINPGPKQEQLPQSKSINQRQQEGRVGQQQKKLLVEDISEINILREEMLKETSEFSNELDELERQLIKRSNELEILTSPQMSEISQKNIALVRQFVNYQEEFKAKLQSQYSDWDKFQNDFIHVQQKLNDILSHNSLVPKLARIQVLEGEISQLIEQVEDLKRKKLRLRA